MLLTLWLQLERETAVFTTGQNDLDGRTREYEAAKQALAEHNMQHDNATRHAATPYLWTLCISSTTF